MKKTVSALTLLIGVQSWAAICGNGVSTDTCKCGNGFSAKCEFYGNQGPFCQSNNPRGADAECGSKGTRASTLDSTISVSPLQLKK